MQRVVPNGKKVRKGEVILWFDTEDLEEKIEELEGREKGGKADAPADG